MKEHESSWRPETIDRQTERWSDELSPEEHQLIQDLYADSQAYSRENKHSLERIWSRFVQSQEEFQGRDIPLRVSLLQEKQPIEPGGKQLFMEGKAMQGKDFYQEIGFSTLSSQPVKRSRRSLWRTLSIGVAAAVVLITILSWAVLSSWLRNGPHNSTANNKQITGTAQKIFSSGSLVCSFSGDNKALKMLLQPTLDWSFDGQVATTYANLKTFSAQKCVQKFSSSLPFTQASWSPDGKRLLVQDGMGGAEVLNASTGRVTASFDDNVPSTSVDQSVWLSGGTQVVSAVTKITSKTTSTVSIQVWDANSGVLIRTTLTFGSDKRLLGLDVGLMPISPNGKYVPMINSKNTIEIWDIDSGKMVGSIPFGQSDVSALAWSPDGASLALGLPNASEVQIWSVARGLMSASFKDNDSSEKIIGALAWSPNGKYLAESASDIHLWDVNAQKIVATFGRVDKSHWIATLAWSRNSSVLASSTNRIATISYQDTVNVWKLS